MPLGAASDVNGPNIRTLDISPDGQLLAIGFETGYLWIATRDGVVRTRVGPLQGKGVDARFAGDGKHVLLTGWFNDGLMNLDGTWVWQYGARNLIGDRKSDLFVALTAPMHGPDYGQIAILDARGKELWSGPGYDASMAIAPNGDFVAFVGKTEKADQSKEPPFPLSPELNATPEIWIRDRNGKELAHGTFPARVIGVSGDSSCILAAPDYSGGRPVPDPRPSWIAGFNPGLKEIWRLDVSAVDSRRVATALLFDFQGDTIRAWRIPPCEP